MKKTKLNNIYAWVTFVTITALIITLLINAPRVINPWPSITVATLVSIVWLFFWFAVWRELRLIRQFIAWVKQLFVDTYSECPKCSANILNNKCEYCEAETWLKVKVLRPVQEMLTTKNKYYVIEIHQDNDRIYTHVFSGEPLFLTITEMLDKIYDVEGNVLYPRMLMIKSKGKIVSFKAPKYTLKK